MMGQLGWVNPLWLWALPIAVGLPVLAHLLSRWTGRRLVFPTIRFLQRAADEGRRRIRLRDLLLLLLRCLALVAIVLAFARPVWHSSAQTPWGSGRHLLILLDRSASMQRASDGATLWDQAQRRAQQLLAQLDPQYDLASVILVDAHPAPLLPEPSAHFSRLEALIAQTPATSERGDIDAALTLAQRMVQAVRPVAQDSSAATPAPTLELISDLQATQQPEAPPATPRLHVHRIGSAQLNFALQKPELTPVVPILNQAATVSVDLVCYSPTSTGLHRAAVRLTWRGQTWTQPVAVHANSTATVRFAFTPTEAGLDHLELSLAESEARSADALPLDNVTGLFFRVAPARPVALVTTAQPKDRTTSVYFLARAMAPDQEIDAPQAISTLAHVQRMVTTPDQLPALLRGPQPPTAVVLAEAGDIPDEALRALRDYLRQGGGVFWILDSNQTWAALRRMDAMQTGGVSPLRGPSEVTSHAGGSMIAATPATLGMGDFEDPILNLFDGPARSELLRSAFHWWGQATLSPQAQALLTYADGQPALAARWIERGRLMVLTASLAPAHTDLVKSPVFAPLIQQILRHLTPGPRPTPNPHPGQSFVLNLPAGPAQPWQLIDPQQQPLALTTTGDPVQGWTLQGPRLSDPGAYTVRVAGQPVAGVQVDLDPRESDLRTQVEDADDPAAAGQATPTTSSSSMSEENSLPSTATMELWPWLVLLGAILLALEQLVLTGTETGLTLRGRMAYGEGGTP